MNYAQNCIVFYLPATWLLFSTVVLMKYSLHTDVTYIYTDMYIAEIRGCALNYNVYYDASVPVEVAKSTASLN